MKKLNSSALKRILKGVKTLNSSIESEPFSTRAISAARIVFDLDYVCFDVFDRQNLLIDQLGQYPHDTWGSEANEILADHIGEHPLFGRIVIERKTKPLSIGESQSARNYYKTTLFNEVYRPLGIRDQLVFGSNAEKDFYFTCCVSRARRDFSSAELQIAFLFQSHLVQAAKNYLLLQKNLCVETFFFRESAKAKILLDEDGKIRRHDENAFEILSKYFPAKADSRRVLPEEVERWRRYFADLRKSENFDFPPQTMTIENICGKLEISLMFDDFADHQIIMLKEKPNPEKKSQLLTKRETEILTYISAGKTDREIAYLCLISPRTVQNHLRNIYEKLGVENRTAAVSCFFYSK